MAHELGITTQPRFSDYAVLNDGDVWDDPEVADQTPLEIAFYMKHLGPPARGSTSDPLVTEGEELFAELGCADCHLPDLGGLPAYTDLLLHDIAPDGAILANTDPAVLPGEFRTPPLWGIGDTAPYLHDGSAETLQAAILSGHAREGEASSAAFAAVESSGQAALLAFLNSL